MGVENAKCPRVNLGQAILPDLDYPLLDMQKKSYASLLSLDSSHADPETARLARQNSLLFKALSSIFPIVSPSKLLELHCEDYSLEAPDRDKNGCQRQGQTYGATMRVKFRLVILEDKAGARKVKQVKEQEVYMGMIPLMTDLASFVVNGTERMVVSQLHRSPGVAFEHDKGRTHSSGKLLHSARVIPYRGAWLDFEIDIKGLLYSRIDRRRKIPATVILLALDLSPDEILDVFYESSEVTFKKDKVWLPVSRDMLMGEIAYTDIMNPSTKKPLVRAGRRITARHLKVMEESKVTSIEVSKDFLVGKITRHCIVEPTTGEILVQANQLIDHDTLETLAEHGVQSVTILSTNDLSKGTAVADTLRVDTTSSREQALLEIYSMMRPGEPPTKDAAENLFKNLFFVEGRYDLSDVGRMKLNKRLGLDETRLETVLSKEDILAILTEFMSIIDGKSDIDDIDNLSNRRVRSVGEMIENQFRVGLVRLERSVRERLSQPEVEELGPQDLVNARAVSAAFNEFFGSSPLSQFMDGVNPLASLTHGDRISALGPGGLSRDRAGFDVRDVHPSHYSRLCPIATPEGPNIGLITALAILGTSK